MLILILGFYLTIFSSSYPFVHGKQSERNLAVVTIFDLGDKKSLQLSDSEFDLIKSALLRHLNQQEADDENADITKEQIAILRAETTESPAKLNHDLEQSNNTNYNCVSGLIPCAELTRYNASNTHCISTTQICDGKADCTDNADEAECFECIKGSQTIHNSHVCDGVKQCEDGSDEKHCKRYCDASEFECSTNGHKPQCIPEEWVCDGYVDCDDFMDETTATCGKLSERCDPIDDFICSHGEFCVPNAWVCDVDNDCGDSSDEVNCEANADVNSTTPLNFEVLTRVMWDGRKSECGTKQSNQYRRIFGGTSAAVGDWPWQVQIFTSTGRTPFCGGSLIHRRWVLTAAHCFQYGNPYEKYYIGVGRHFTNKFRSQPNSVIMPIEKLIIHPKHDSRRQRNDIALIELKLDVPRDVACNTICLPSIIDIERHKLDFSNAPHCYVTGFGIINTRRHRPTVLQEAKLPMIDNRVCNRPYIYGPLVTPHMLCAGFLEGVVDACLGDSGGPYACLSETDSRWYLVGITSWGKGCSRPYRPGVYTRVADYYDWISQNCNCT